MKIEGKKKIHQASGNQKKAGVLTLLSKKIESWGGKKVWNSGEQQEE